MMKDYLTYTMMQSFGVSSSLCSFVYITVNGEDWGLYLAVEGVEEAFLERNYGADYGELYKPDSMSFGGGRGNGKDFNMDEFDFASAESQPDESFEPPSMPEGGQPQGGDRGGMGGRHGRRPAGSRRTYGREGHSHLCSAGGDGRGAHRRTGGYEF